MLIASAIEPFEKGLEAKELARNDLDRDDKAQDGVKSTKRVTRRQRFGDQCSTNHAMPAPHAAP